MKRPKQIRIEPALNGYIVTCGCQSVVFESRHKLVEEMSKYLIDPDGVEKAYLKDAINPMPDDAASQCVANEAVGGRALINRLDPVPAPYQQPTAQGIRR